jgi:hypothetical protein
MKYYLITLILLISTAISTRIFFKADPTEGIPFPGLPTNTPSSQTTYLDGFQKITTRFELLSKDVQDWLQDCEMEFDNDTYVFVYTFTTIPEVTFLDKGFGEGKISYRCSPNPHREEGVVIEKMESLFARAGSYGVVGAGRLENTYAQYADFLMEFLEAGPTANIEKYVNEFYQNGFASVRYFRTNFFSNIILKAELHEADEVKLTAFKVLCKVLTDNGFFDGIPIKPFKSLLPLQGDDWRDGHTVLLDLITYMYTKGQKVGDIKAFQEYLKGVNESQRTCVAYKYYALLELENNRDVGIKYKKVIEYYETIVKNPLCNDEQRLDLHLDKCRFILMKGFYKATQKCLADIDEKFKTNNEVIYLSVLNHLQMYHRLSTKDDEVAKAEQYLTQAKEKLGGYTNKKEYHYYLLEAVINLIQGNVEKFQSFLDKALELRPHHPEPNYFRWLVGKKLNYPFVEKFESSKLNSDYFYLGLYTMNLGGDKNDYRNILQEASYYFKLALKTNPQDFYSERYTRMIDYILRPKGMTEVENLIKQAEGRGFIWQNKEFIQQKLHEYQFPFKRIAKDYRSLYYLLEVYLNKYLGAYDSIFSALRLIKDDKMTDRLKLPSKGNLESPFEEVKKNDFIKELTDSDGKLEQDYVEENVEHGREGEFLDRRHSQGSDLNSAYQQTLDTFE